MVAGLGEHVSKPMIGFIGRIPAESIVDVIGELVVPEDDLISCTIKLELRLHKIFVVSQSIPQLPFQMKDAIRPLKEGESEGLGE